MMKLKLIAISSLLALIFLPGLALAKEHGFVMSIMNVIPQEQMYKVEMQRIDDKNPMPAEEYYVAAGEHSFRVSLVPDPTWSPKLMYANHEISAREITITIEDKTTYQIGGKVDPDASEEAQRNGTFWEPVIYKTLKR